MLISRNPQKKISEVSIKTRSTPGSLSFKGQENKNATVKWSIVTLHLHITNFYLVENIIFQENKEETGVLLNLGLWMRCKTKLIWKVTP